MKKSKFLILLAFILPIASAFTSNKLVNPTGFANLSGMIFSGETNNPNCAVQATGTNCSIFIMGTPIQPVYETMTDAENQTASKILRFQ
jgi:hypothetical protein